MRLKSVVILFYLLVVGLQFSCSNKAKKSNIADGSLIKCSMEFTQGSDFVENGFLFNNGHTRSTDFARTGTYSSKLDSNNRFGPTIILDSLNPGESVFVTCWVKGGYNKAVLCAQGVDGFDFYRDNRWVYDNISTAYCNVDSNNWYQVQLKLLLVGNYENEKLKIYTLHPEGVGDVFFDDLSIKRGNAQDREYPQYNAVEMNRLSIEIDSGYFEKMKLKRVETFKTGILLNDIGWGKGKLSCGDERKKIKVRLKGDYPDHLEGIKWSLRIKYKDSTNCDNPRVFSLQAAHTRHFLDEWVLHQLMKQEGVIAPNYDFVDVTVNDKHLGLFAREEHFTDDLIKNSGRAMAPIMKFSEDELWDFRAINNGKDFSGVPLFMSSPTTAFEYKKIKKDSLLYDQFVAAQKLLFQYKLGKAKPSEIFDIEKLAKYYAITELCRATHGRVWHNMRFYYNPTIEKLEPICYDGYVENGVSRGKEELIYSKDILKNEIATIFNDNEFRNYFIDYVKKYFESGWLDDFFDSHSVKLERYEKLLQLEYPDYKYNYNFLKGNALELIADIEDSNKVFGVRPNPKNGDKEEFPLIKNISAVCYRPLNGTSITIYNYHNRDLEIIGLGKTEINRRISGLDQIRSYSGQGVPNKIEFDWKEHYKYVFYKTESGKKGRSKILSQPPPE